MKRISINKHLVVAGMVVAFCLIMLVGAGAGEAREVSGADCTVPLPIVVQDAELCRTPADGGGSEYEGARTEGSTSSSFPLEWFVTGVVVSLAVLIVFALEAPSARPFVPATPTQGVSL